MDKFVLVGGNRPVGIRYHIDEDDFKVLIAGTHALRAALLLADAAGVNTKFSVKQIEDFTHSLHHSPTKEVERNTEFIVDADDSDGIIQEMLVASAQAAQARFVQERADVALGFAGNTDTGWHRGTKSDSCDDLLRLFNGPTKGEAQRDQ